MSDHHRTKRVTTGLVREGVPEVIEYRDDGYRIYAKWITGRPFNVAPTEEIHVCDYKYCDIGRVADVLFNDFFRSSDPTPVAPTREPWKRCADVCGEREYCCHPEDCKSGRGIDV